MKLPLKFFWGFCKDMLFGGPSPPFTTSSLSFALHLELSNFFPILLFLRFSLL